MNARSNPRRTRRGHATVFRGVVVAVLSTAVIAIAALGPNQPHATADAITDKIGVAKKGLANDKAIMASLRNELAAAANQETLLVKAIADLDAQIASLNTQVANAQAQLAAVAAQLTAAQASLVATQLRLAADRRQLQLEIVVMYKAQNASNSFSNFLNSGDFNSLWQHVLDVHRLGESEQRLIDAVTTEEWNVQAEVAQISLDKAQKTQALATLDGIVAQTNAALAAKQQSQQNLLALQARDQANLAAATKQAAEAAAQIAALQVQEAAALAAGGGNGHFAWPETGPINLGFGCTTFGFEPPPQPWWGYPCSTGHFHTGIDIGAPYGNNVTAADSGIAHLYQDFSGYGNYIIIVHGNGWVTLYGHLAGWAIRDGQTVHRGQLIGYEGSTGNSSGPHLHFEIDLNNRPVNPLAYL
jgi:murein DD-endopeptidase MepM/ murein hydrolase activator NlpD